MIHSPSPQAPAIGPFFAGAGRATFGQAASSVLGMKWSSLLDAANVVCTLAGIEPEPRRPEIRNFPAAVKELGGWRLALAEQGIEDLAAMMEPGLVALLAVHARGVNPAPAALALWREFSAARAALLALAPPQAVRRQG